MSDELEQAERLKHLIVDPVVESLQLKIEGMLKPLIDTQTAQAETLKAHDLAIADLKASNKRAMLGWGVYASGVALGVGSAWGWIKSHFGWH